MKNQRNKGITLIALVITVIVLLILSGVAISAISGNESAVEKAKEAKEKTNISTLIDETNFELINLKTENNLANLTVSEKIDKLKENDILNNDMTFKSNNDYTLTYTGNILDNNGSIINKINLADNITPFEVNCQPQASNTNGTRIVKVIDGKLYFTNETDKSTFYIEANPAPDGYKFAYWIDQNNNIIDYRSSNSDIAVITDMTYTAIYVKKNINIIPKVVVNVYSTTQTPDNKLQFQSYAYMPNSTSSFEHTSGVLATNNVNFANENYMTVDKETNTSNPSELFYKKKANGSGTGITYAWGKKDVGTDTWYVRGYSIIKNIQTGETQTYYSDIISAHK